MTSDNKKFLIFKLQGFLYALDLAQVAEVCDPPRMSPIPLAPGCYSGALNFHGDIVAVMNLTVFLGLDGCRPPEKLVVLHQKVAALAFLVDSVVRIVSGDEVSYRTPPDNVPATAKLDLVDGEALLLDLDALVQEAENGIQKYPAV
jgi:purine-binding chemotaxis protein CheW